MNAWVALPTATKTIEPVKTIPIKYMTMKTCFDAPEAVCISSGSLEKTRTNGSGMKNKAKKDMIHHEVDTVIAIFIPLSARL